MNFFFIILHIIGVFLGFWILIFSIPMHVFYNMSKGRTKELKKQTEILEKQANQNNDEPKVEELEKELEEMKKKISELKEDNPPSATGKMK